MQTKFAPHGMRKDGIGDLHNKFASRKRHHSVGCGAEAHSFGELKLILSKFGGTQQSANKFAFASFSTFIKRSEEINTPPNRINDNKIEVAFINI